MLRVFAIDDECPNLMTTTVENEYGKQILVGVVSSIKKVSIIKNWNHFINIQTDDW